MRRRVEETLDLLGIAELRDVPLRELSGGQQQRVAIGSVLTAHPRVILLDEPTSALDPTGAEEVLATITRLVHDLAVTVVVAEHRVERVLHYADTVVHVSPSGEVRSGLAVGPHGRQRHRASRGRAGPVCRVVAAAAVGARRAPARPWACAPGSRRPCRRCRPTGAPPGGRRSCSARGVVVRYPGDVVAVARVDLDLHAGQVTAVMGRNGCGKSSLLWALQGSGPRPRAPCRARHASSRSTLAAGERRSLVGLVPQTAADLLYLDTVGAECDQADRESGVPGGTCAALLEGWPPASRRAAPARPVRGAEAGARAGRAAHRRPRRCCCSTSRPAASTPRPRPR